MHVVHSPSSRTGLVLMAGVVAVVGTLAAATLGPKLRTVATSSSIGTVPAGYRAMTLGTVTPLSNGEYAVELVDGDRAITLYVGASEGWAITLRSEGRKFVRPLTVDLLDSTMQQLGGELDRIQVDQILDRAYHGSLHLHRGAEHFQIDARPSDAIALALGNHVPILVADGVIAEAGHPCVP
jgi:bifunctional DNase/RNase